MGNAAETTLYLVNEAAPEEAHDMGMIFAEAIDELIDDLSKRAESFAQASQDAEAQLLVRLAAPWLRRKATQYRVAAVSQTFLEATHTSDLPLRAG